MELLGWEVGLEKTYKKKLFLVLKKIKTLLTSLKTLGAYFINPSRHWIDNYIIRPIKKGLIKYAPSVLTAACRVPVFNLGLALGVLLGPDARTVVLCLSA